jgi:hypothetical protein
MLAPAGSSPVTVSQLPVADSQGATAFPATAPFTSVAPQMASPTRVAAPATRNVLGPMLPGFPVVASAVALGHEGAVARASAAPMPAPAIPQPPVPPTGVVAGAGGFSTGFGSNTFAVLVAFMSLAALGFAARLRIPPVAYRPVAFISLLERPG